LLFDCIIFTVCFAEYTIAMVSSEDKVRRWLFRNYFCVSLMNNMFISSEDFFIFSSEAANW